MEILVTGATGFVGSALVARLRRDDWPVTEMRRSGEPNKGVMVADLSVSPDITAQLSGITTIVHCAARVHMLRDNEADPLQAFRKINRDATLRLAEQAAAAGIKRFVYLSSIKVNGESTQDGQSFKPEDPPRPADPYGISKAEAEDGLRRIAAATGMEVVIVRPPIVYGPGVRANFAALIRLLRKKIPLPLGAISSNRRSMIALDNLVDFLIACVTSAKAANQTFLVSDGEDVSTASLLRRLGAAMDVRVRLVPLPASALLAVATLLRRGDSAQRLLGSLQVDMTKARTLLGWQPPISMDEGLRRAAAI